jgi:hypothetical protein
MPADKKTTARYLIAIGAGLAIGYLVARGRCPVCRTAGQISQEQDNRPSLMKISQGLGDICEEIGPLVQEINRAYANDQRIDGGETLLITRQLGRLF